MSNYEKRIPFTQNQMDLLMSNPFTAKVSPHRILFTLEFKRFAMDEINKPGMTANKVFKKAGYDVDIIGRERVKSSMAAIKREAASPYGLQEPKEGTREQMLQRRLREDITQKHTKTALKDLNERVIHLEQQIEFLKKISHLDKKK